MFWELYLSADESVNGGNSKAAHYKRCSVSREGVSHRVKWRNEPDRMAQDAMVDVRRSPSRIARDSNLIRISS